LVSAPSPPIEDHFSGAPAENYGIVSHGAIGGVWVGGSQLTLPWLFGNIAVAQNWR
jgi:hypothetical protein